LKPIFPFSAVLGQERLKLALLLCAVDPSIGGVLVRGPRGVAKTTLARGFAELLPGRFVELPLGATEERVTGTLDLESALAGGQVKFAPGLLARAHEGVLYVDEVNLLPDGLVDLLLDAAATGQSVVERDGVSHEHAARFVLIGTMNPDEGELRQQFVDRFGLSVSADREIARAERAEIVRRRIAFEQDPPGFSIAHAAEQRALVERCRAAREQARSIGFAGPASARVAELCHAAGVDGVRADLAMLRAARAHAAWRGGQSIEVEDVDAVAELALAHRRQARRGTPTPGGSISGSRPPSAPPAGPASSKVSSAPTGASSPAVSRADASTVLPADEPSGRAEPQGDRGALPALPVLPLPMAVPDWLELGTPRRGPRRPLRARASRSSPRGRRPARGGIDWCATLLAAPWPSFRDLRYRTRLQAPERLWIVALDCSASMLGSGALAAAKGVVQALVGQAARSTSHVALISFRQQGAQRELIARSRRERVDRTLVELGAGGGTPLRGALLEAIAVSRRPAYRGDQVEKCLLLLSDGRTRESVADLRFHFREIALTLLDCERGPLRLERARSLAAALGARYAHIDAMESLMR
jgi:magnesium chelatase subunit D